MMYIVCPTDMRGGLLEDNVVSLLKDDQVKVVYTRHELAVAKAQERAGKEPGRGFAVMCIEKVYEAKAPQIMTKKVDARGQLVLDDSNG